MSRLQARFDHVVLTAANAAQARGYRSQLRWRLDRGLLNHGTCYHVIPDPRGRRVGSFGATLNALYELAVRIARDQHASGPHRLRDLFANRRILICHSGGDSRRVPAYAAQGKAFIPLPTGLTSTTLFDLILARAGEWPAAEGQVLIVSGDVLLTFDPALLDFTAPGVTGVACPGTLERGSRHGVYVTDRDLVAHERVPVRNFLQKPDGKTAREQCAIDSVGRVLVDTGIVNLHATAVETVLTSAGVRRAGERVRFGEGLLNDILRGACPLMDLYEEFAMALAKPSAREYCRAVRARIADARHERRLVRFFKAIHGMPFSVCVLPHCDFFHIGTSRELLANMSTLTPTAQQYGFANRHCSTVHGDAMVDGAFIYNSMVETAKIRTGPGVFLEACRVNGPLELAGNNILVGLPHEMRAPLRLAENTGLVFLPVGTNRWTAVLFGLDDDFKGARGAGTSVFSTREGHAPRVRFSPGVLGHTECDPPEFTRSEPARDAGRCLFLNRPVDEWLARHGVAPDELWGQHAGETLWEARLWPVGTLDAMAAHLRWMQQAAPASPGALRRWRQSRRLSLSQLLGRIDHDRLIRHRSEIQRLVGLDTLSDWLIRNPFRPSAHLHAL
ncbi:MAG: hypothetical protein HY343_12625, partial [Lentisphaerae bacterium]|nr:hypothetical protein [Lentisphaerota bacterium]